MGGECFDDHDSTITNASNHFRMRYADVFGASGTMLGMPLLLLITAFASIGCVALAVAIFALLRLRDSPR